MLVAAEASRKMQQTGVHHVLSQGSWPQITGPLAVVGRTGSREGVGCDLLSLTGPSVAAAAVVTVLVNLWGPR